MLYLLYLLKEDFILFNVFKYITFRSFGAGVTAFLISVVLGKTFINYLVRKQFKENIRSDGPPEHKNKAGMGCPTVYVYIWTHRTDRR
jgi:phospho-N-acetylmuramoyl-pentapeptide-transferase